MSISKRGFLKMAGVGGVAALTGTELTKSFLSEANATPVLATKSGLTNIRKDIKPISAAERKARVAKAQHLMRENGISALILDASTSLIYFTGLKWSQSERFTGAVIPAEGDIAIVTPFFERPRALEGIAFGDDVRPWHEHENPFKLIKQIINDRGFNSGKIAFDSRVRFFIMEGVKAEASNFEMVGGDAIVNGCRMMKSTHEIELMKKANEIQIAAYQYLHSKVEKGMTPAEVWGLMNQVVSDLGGEGVGGMCLLNEASAYPHGSKQPQVVEEGGVVLLDGGTKVHGYSSDISRTFVYGEATKRQRDVWNLMRDGQMLGFETAQIGTPCGEVDRVVREFYEKNGFGPGYQAPGLTHRLGHGIGMDVHEPVNFVRDEKTPLQPGMCFSNEPGIYIYGEFGIRLEDCLYMTEDGPEWFSVPPTSLDNPMAV